MIDRESGPQPLKFEHAICVSASTRNILVEAGIPVSHARIIHTGIDVSPYLNNNHPYVNNEHPALEMLYAGRLTADKGVATLIQAMAMLVSDESPPNVSLSLAGSGSEDYEEYLRFLVAQAGLKSYVSFLGHVPFDQIPDLMRKFDVLLVPSTWQEPFSRVVLEGMISGLVVVATATGGTGEILNHGKNGLLFSPGNANELAEKISVLAGDPELRRKLAHAGHETVLKRFTVSRMLDEIESYFKEIAILQ
jgi:glycosyltransferase involved in cell wall biosynthesis